MTVSGRDDESNRGSIREMIPFKRLPAIDAAIIILISVMGLTSSLRAEPEEPACYHFTGKAQIALKSGFTMSGSAPATFCDLKRGDKYRLLATGNGLERRLGTLSIGVTGAPSISGIRMSTSMRNAIPGFGYYDVGIWEAAVTDELSLVASLYLLYMEHREFEHLENRYTIYMENLDSADLLESKQILERAAQEAAIDVNVQNKYRKRLAAVCAYIYGWQLLDPIVLFAPPRTSIEGTNTIHLEVPGSSKPKAFILSLLRPGRGQFYQGKKGRGAAFNILTAAAGLTALEYHNRYDVEESRYVLLIERHDKAETLEEREQLALQASAQWDDVEKAKRRRNMAYIVTAGLWGWNIIDTFFYSGGGEDFSRYSLELGPTSSALVIRF